MNAQTGWLLFLLVATVSGINVLNSVVQLVRKADSHAGWLSGVLALLAGAATMGALFIHVFVVNVDPVLLPALLGFGGLQLLFGVAFALLERRRSTFVAEQSFGLLLAVIGGFILTVTVLVPVLPGQLSPPAVAVSVSATPTVSSTPVLTVTPSPTATDVLSPTPTLTWTPSSTPSSTPTREHYSTRTPTPTPVIEAFCGAVVNYNLNLRAEPSREGELLQTIPYESVIQVGGQNENGSWWFVNYNENTWGWVDGEFISTDPLCRNAPVIEPGG